MPGRIRKVKAWLIGIVLVGLALMIAESAWRLYASSTNYCLNSSEGFDPRTAGTCGADMDQYVDYSNSLMSGHGYSAKFGSTIYTFPFNDTDFYIPETNRMPGFPVLLSVLRSIDPARRTLHYFNLFCCVVILVCSAVLARKYLGNFQALLLTIWLLNNVQLRVWVYGGNTDIVSTAAAAAFAALLFMRREGPITLLLCFLLGTFGVFLRANTLLFFLPLMLAVMFLERRWKMLLPICGIVVALGAWCARNYFVSGHATLSTMSGNQLFLEYVSDDFRRPEMRWHFWYGGPIYTTIKAVKAGENINHAWAATDVIVGNMAWEWMWSHPSLVAEKFVTAWGRLMDIKTEGWLKLPMDFLDQAAKGCAYAALLVIAFVVALRQWLRREGQAKRSAGVALCLCLATIAFLLPTNFWHGDWVSIRGSLEILPALFYLLIYLGTVAAGEILQ